MVAAVAIDQDDRNLRLFHLLVKFVRIHTDYNDSIQIPLLGQRQIAFICVRCRNQNMIAAQTGIVFNAAENFTVKTVRFLYKGIIIKHNKTEPTYTKTSLFLCEKRRFLWPGLRKEGNLFKLAGPGGLAFFSFHQKGG